MQRHLAIGDIHGCLQAFNTLLSMIEPRPDDFLITLGDYVDRGPDSCGVLQRLVELDQTHQLFPIRGNHEIMMFHAGENDEDFRRWRMVGGEAVLQSYGLDPDEGRSALRRIPAEHWSFLRKKLLPYYESETHFFVHANAYPDMSLEEQPDLMLYWEHFNYPAQHQSGKVMICGHTSQKSGFPLQTPEAVCIDTWACGNGWLSCLEVETGTLFQANQNGHTRCLNLDECP